MLKKIEKKLVKLLRSGSKLRQCHYPFYEQNSLASDKFRNELILFSFTSLF